MSSNRKNPTTKRKNQPKLDGGGLQALNHWKEFRPKMYAELEKSGRLYEAAQQAADQTMDALMALLQKGMDYQTAWESVREQWMFLPSEEDLPELGVDPDEFPGGSKT
jgi:hypothetical protein